MIIRNYTHMPWKNGNGVTEQIAIAPDGATLERFDWRLSMAWVSEGGPFSQFPACDRILVICEGEGLTLRRARSVIDVVALTPFRFSGDEPVSATLERGPIRDFNVIFDRARVRASCEVLRVTSLELARVDGEQFLVCLSGSFVAGASTVIAGETLRDSGRLALHGDAVALRVCLTCAR